MTDWIYFKDVKICSCHHKKVCPDTPLFPVENSKSKNDVSLPFTSNSQAITSNSQGVLKRKYVRKSVDSIFERFHNFGVKFEAKVEFEHLFKYPEVRLRNNVSYKRIDLDLAIVKVFRKSILVTLRASKEVNGLNVKEAEKRSIGMVLDVLKLLPKAIQVSDSDIVNLHNAFVNHPFAKHELNVKVNEQTRLISDRSKGRLELEAVNPEFVVKDSQAIELDLIGLIDKGLSRDVLASNINALINDRKFWAEHQRSHVEAIQTLSATVKDLRNEVHCHSGGHKSPLFVLPPDDESQDFNIPPKDIVLPETFSFYDVQNKSKKYRLFRARQLLKDYGWGDSVW